MSARMGDRFSLSSSSVSFNTECIREVKSIFVLNGEVTVEERGIFLLDVFGLIVSMFDLQDTTAGTRNEEGDRGASIRVDLSAATPEPAVFLFETRDLSRVGDTLAGGRSPVSFSNSVRASSAYIARDCR